MRRDNIPERKARSVVFGDFWGRALVRRAQAWEEEGVTATHSATCLRPRAGHPLSGLGLNPCNHRHFSLTFMSALFSALYTH